jgi:hypothetical protein
MEQLDSKQDYTMNTVVTQILYFKSKGKFLFEVVGGCIGSCRKNELQKSTQEDLYCKSLLLKVLHQESETILQARLTRRCNGCLDELRAI